MRSDYRPSRGSGRRGRRLGVVVAVALAMLATLVAAAPAKVGTTVAPRVVWRDCGGGFECATIKVPLDYDRPHGRRIELALIRLPAGNPARRIGSLFTNPGGPGTSGIGHVRDLARLAYPAKVQARFDIVGFDPRGVGASTPVRCFDSPEEQQAVFQQRSDNPSNAATVSARRRRCIGTGPALPGTLPDGCCLICRPRMWHGILMCCVPRLVTEA